MTTRNGFVTPGPDVDGPNADAAVTDAAAASLLIARHRQLGVATSIDDALGEVSGMRDLNDPRVRAKIVTVRVAEKAALGVSSTNSTELAALRLELAADAPRRQSVLALMIPGEEDLVRRLSVDGHTSATDAAQLVVASMQRKETATAGREQDRAAAGRAHADTVASAGVAKKARAYVDQERRLGHEIPLAADAVAHITMLEREADLERQRIEAVAAEERARLDDRRKADEARAFVRIASVPAVRVPAPAAAAPALTIEEKRTPWQARRAEIRASSAAGHDAYEARKAAAVTASRAR